MKRLQIIHKSNPPHHVGWCVYRQGSALVTYVQPLWRALWLAFKRRNLWNDQPTMHPITTATLIALGCFGIWAIIEIFV